MAEGKKSVLLYCDLIHTVEKMDDKTAGEFFKHYLRYINDQNPTTENIIVDLTFEPVKQNLKRDLIKYQEVKAKRSLAGKESARLRALNKSKQNPTSVESVEQTSTNPTVTDTVNVTVTDTVNVKDINNIYIQPDKQIFEPSFKQLETKTEKTISEDVFLKRWKDAREYYDKKPTNINKLSPFEKIDFIELTKDYNLLDFEKAMKGMFQQSTFPKTRLRPTHFLKRENFETYLTCFSTKEVLFKKETKNNIQRL